MTVPPAPKKLTTRSRDLWRSVLSDFELAPAELVSLEQALRLLDRADEAAARVAAEGMSVLDRYGGIRAHPLVDVEVRCRRQFVDIAKSLGVRLDETSPRTRAGGKPG